MLFRPARSISLAILVGCACTATAIKLSASEAQNSSARERTGNAPAGCPVTKPTEAFSPPAPYGSNPPAGSIFFGTPKLWTLLWINSWQGRKLVWWSPGNDQKTDSMPGLAVTFKPLDSSDSPLMTDHSNWAYIPGKPAAITTGVRWPPTAGCWEITGRLKEDEVKYVVWLGPRPAN